MKTHEVTELLHAWRDGDSNALDKLAPRVYRDLRRLAQHQLSGEQGEITLNATSLVHEV